MSNDAGKNPQSNHGLRRSSRRFLKRMADIVLEPSAADRPRTQESAYPPTLDAKKQIKKATRNLIFRYILEKKQVSMADISRQLVISLPTIAQHVAGLKKMGVLIEDGHYESTGGRRAKVLSVNPGSKIACGVNITHSALDVVAVDLLGRVIDYVKEDIPCRISHDYLSHLRSLLTGMIEKIVRPEQTVLGVGISIPAIVDGEGIIYDTAFDTPLPQDFHQMVQAYVPVPITFVNDASSGGYAEFWHCKTRDNLFYLSLSDTVGGAARVHNRVLPGDDYRSAEIGHTTIVPNGRQCYCGQRGCMNTYCSSKCLASLTGGSLTSFFGKLANGDAECRERWNEYLDYLAIAINNIRLLFDCEVILGGSVGRFIPGYVPALSERLRARDSFHRTTEYLRLCEYHSESSAVGAALMYVDQFIAQI